MKVNYSLSLALLALLFITTYSNPTNFHTNYTFTFNNIVRHQAAFSLGYIDKNYTVMINITKTSAGTGTLDFTSALNGRPTIHLIRLNTSHFGTIFSCTTYDVAPFVPTSNNIVYVCKNI
jgi:hypothetical protein